MDARPFVRYAPLASAILIAAVLQAILIARAPTISADGIIFTRIARDLSHEPVAAFRTHDQHPGYPAAMLAATRVVQWLGYRAEPESWMIGGRAVSYICGLLSVWVVWLLARDLYDVRVANLAALVFAILPLPRVDASDAQSDMPHALFYLTAAWLASRAIASGRLLPLAGAGLASAIAYWIRPEGLEVFLVAMVFVVWRGVREPRDWKRAGLAAATLAGVTLMAAAPYPILTGKITSKQLPFVKQQDAPTYIAQVAEVAPRAEVQPAPGDVPQQEPTSAESTPSEPTPPEPTIASPPVAPAVAPAVTAAPAVEPERRYTVGLVVRLAARAIGSLIECFCNAFRYIFIPLYLLGQWEMIRRQSPARVIGFLWMLAVLHMAALLYVYFVSGYIATRHVLPLLGLAMPFTALGILYASEKLGGLLRVRSSRVALATLGTCALVVLPYSVRAYNREFVPVIEATRWVQTRAAPGAGVVCNSPYVAYYGTLPTTVLGPDALTLDAALADGAPGVRYDYVVLHVNAHDYRPEWMEQVARRYRMVREYHDPTVFKRPRKVVVFEALEAQARRKASDSKS